MTFSEPGDLAWRAMAAEKFENAKLDADSIKQVLNSSMASSVLKES